eukprot:scaffold289947_cov51-Attheya_sp.AAC.3
MAPRVSIIPCWNYHDYWCHYFPVTSLSMMSCPIGIRKPRNRRILHWGIGINHCQPQPQQQVVVWVWVDDRRAIGNFGGTTRGMSRENENTIPMDWNRESMPQSHSYESK